MDIYSSRVQDAWQIMEPVIAVARQRSPGVWENFEYLVVRAEAFDRRSGTQYPSGMPRKRFSERSLAIVETIRERRG